MVTITPETARPTPPSSIFCVSTSMLASLKAVSMVEVSVSIDTQAAAKLIAWQAEKTGLLYFLYFTMFTIAAANETKVYAASQSP